MVVAVAELDVELHAAEERRGRVEDDRVGSQARAPGAQPSATPPRPRRSRHRPRPSAPSRSRARRGTPGGRLPPPRRYRGCGSRLMRRGILSPASPVHRRRCPPRRRARAARRGRPPRRRRRAGRPGAGRRRRAPRPGPGPGQLEHRPSARPPGRRACPARSRRCRRGRGSPRRRACQPQRLAGSQRIGAAAAACDEQRLLDLEQESLRSFEADRRRRGRPERRPRPAPQPCEARTEAQIRGRAMRDTGAALGDCRCRCRRGARSARTRRPVEPAEPLQVLHRPAAVELGAVRLLLDGLGQVRVKQQAAPRANAADSSISRPVTENGEQGATAICTQPVPSVQRAEPLGVGEHLVELLHERVGRQAAVRLAEVHRAARGDDPDPELAAARTSASIRPASRAGRRSGGRRRSCSRSASSASPVRAAAYSASASTRPTPGRALQPGEEVGLLRPRAGKGLVQVVVRVDEAGRDDGAAEVDRSPPRRPPAADRRDEPSSTAPSRRGARSRVVHRDDPARWRGGSHGSQRHELEAVDVDEARGR